VDDTKADRVITIITTSSYLQFSQAAK